MCKKPCICQTLKDSTLLEKKFLDIWVNTFTLTDEAKIEVEAKNAVSE